MIESDPISHVFHAILSRLPDDEERQLLGDLHQLRLARYTEDPVAAARLMAVGASLADPKLDVGQVAALADVCHAVLNLSETITRK